MHVLLIEPYYGGSHRAWADGYRFYSTHDIHLMTMPAQFWKWRMQGGAVTLARRFMEQNLNPDVILISDMVDVSTFRALTRSAHIPTALYFHESQFSYPQNSRQNHGWRYAFTNYISAMAADAVFFNSVYHHDVFFENLPRMLKHFGDFNELDTVDRLREKSLVLPLGLDLRRYDAHRHTRDGDLPPLIVWNHRWEDEKNPAAFFDVLYRLDDEGIDFRVALFGENVRQEPSEFEQARVRLSATVVQYGYAEDFTTYARLLWQADYAISTAYQEFFGGAMAEAIYCGCIPLMPRRLNYPYLVPEVLHDACLYKGDSLYYLLRRHLMGKFSVQQNQLRDHIAQFDWSRMAPRYDTALSELQPTTPF